MAVQETKQALSALIKFGVKAREVGRDGYELSDAGLVIKDDALQQALADALEGAERIPYELSHLSFADTIDLVQVLAEAAKLFKPAT